MVVVSKLSGNVRICVDLKPLNQHILREPHSFPHYADEALLQLTGATKFSKLMVFGEFASLRSQHHLLHSLNLLANSSLTS